MVYGPTYYLQFNSTSEEMSVRDTAVNLTASYNAVQNGQIADSDRYYCVAGSEDQCFGNLPNQSVDVMFRGKYTLILTE